MQHVNDDAGGTIRLQRVHTDHSWSFWTNSRGLNLNTACGTLRRFTRLIFFLNSVLGVGTMN